jgi:hypothetical protein
MSGLLMIALKNIQIFINLNSMSSKQEKKIGSMVEFFMVEI